jgi:acetylornithine aminotransferase
MLEPIQGEGGVICPAPGYLQGVKELCEAHDLLLIFDEIQVGMGRTGRLFAHEHTDTFPHIMTLAKALGNGLPIGAMLAVEELNSAFGPGSHATTFGGTPLVTAVAKAVLQSLLDDGWIDHCREMGEMFIEGLEGLKAKHTSIKDVRGAGLILGLELDRPGNPIVEACLEQGLIINCVQEGVLRFVPPLIVGESEIDRLLRTLDKLL